MKLFSPYSSSSRKTAAFTMVEIALALAVIGFALVAIIGILPKGLNVQKDNREMTVINFDAAFLTDALRSGARGQDNLTNYIISITNVSIRCDSNGIPVVGQIPSTNWFTRYGYSINNSPTVNTNLLTNGYNIVGLLSVPKYMPVKLSTNTAGPDPVVIWGFYSNTVTAEFRGMTGPAMDHGTNQSSRDFSFTYRVNVETVPSASYPFSASDDSSVNAAGPGFVIPLVGDTNELNATKSAWRYARDLQRNLMEIRLRYRWPVLPDGSTPTGNRLTFRTSVSGGFDSVPNPDVPGMTNYFVTPLIYSMQGP